MKVIVIGAGIAGLTFAAACFRAGIDVKVYEKAKQLRNMGGGLLLWPHSLRYLAWMGLSAPLNPYHIAVKRCRIINPQGKKIFSEDYASFYALIGGAILPIDRSLLQKTLAAQLPSARLTLGKACIGVKNEAQQALVFFADGTQERADLVVGADGIYSVVRGSLNPNATFQYTQHCWWGGIIQQASVPMLSPEETFIAVGLGKLCVAWPLHSNRLMWYLPVKMAQAEWIEGKGRATAQLKARCADWSREVQAIISAPQLSSFYLPIHTLSPLSSLTCSRITLIGDAAHALGPVLGQGANHAIEDAFVLVNCLQRLSDDIPSLLNRYESLRLRKSQRLFELENQSAAMMIHEDHATLEGFQQALQGLDLATFYQPLIPLVNEKFCLALAAVLQ